MFSSRLTLLLPQRGRYVSVKKLEDLMAMYYKWSKPARNVIFNCRPDVRVYVCDSVSSI